MWKVRRVEDGDRTILRLSGRLAGEQLNELEHALASEAATQSLILDLIDVRLVDREVVTFLADCEAGGVSLRNCPAYIREWIAAKKAGRDKPVRPRPTNPEPGRPSGSPSKPGTPNQPDRSQPRPSRPTTPGGGKSTRPTQPSEQPGKPGTPS